MKFRAGVSVYASGLLYHAFLLSTATIHVTMPRNPIFDDDDVDMGHDFVNRMVNAPDDDIAMLQPAPRNPDAGFVNAHDPTAENQTPLQQLIRHWMNERHSPEILEGQEGVLGMLLDHIRRQTETVTLLKGDPDSSEEEHFRIVLAQTEIERVKFIVRSYLRTRLYKIEKYARWIIRKPEYQTRLSQTELEHAKRYAKIWESHLQTSLLDALPEPQRNIVKKDPFTPPMIPEPDNMRPVFVHALDECPPVVLPDGTTLQAQKGHIALTPYAVVEQLLAIGLVELV